MAEINLIMIVLGIVLASILILILVWHFFRTHRVHQALRDINRLLPTESLEQLKAKYLQAYDLYLRLSERQKRKVYGPLSQVREQVEELLRSQKKVEELLDKPGTLEQRKQWYDELQQHYQRLSLKEQEKWYAQMVHLKQSLERGG